MVKRSGKRKWVARVQSRSDAMDLEPGVFKKKSAKGMAKSVLRSVKCSRRRKGSTLSSGIAMMTYYANCGGRNVSPQQKRTIKKAKDEYRKLVGREK
jgi:hypothetical protein